MEEKSGQIRKNISEEISKGNFELYKTYVADDVCWNILGNSPIIGKEKVQEVLKMSQLESFPVITIKTIIAEGNTVVIPRRCWCSKGFCE